MKAGEWVIPVTSRQNFDQGKKNEIQHNSYKERLRIIKTANIGC